MIILLNGETREKEREYKKRKVSFGLLIWKKCRKRNLIS